MPPPGIVVSIAIWLQFSYTLGNSLSMLSRRPSAPEVYGAFRIFGQRASADGGLSPKTKELIAVPVT